ncbi:MAG: hypothetical protein ABIJ00_08845 [Candidatus Eisenbacteria bacterium]
MLVSCKAGLRALEVDMDEVMPLSTILAFGLPPIGFIIAIVCYYVFTSEDD